MRYTSRMAKRDTILVYSTPPAETGDLLPSLYETFGNTDINIKQIWAKDVVQGDVLRSDRSVLILPGAPYSQGYRDQLNGAGFKNIREAIHDHKLNMFGICCSAYLSCPSYSFTHPDGEFVTHTSELALIDATAHGPIDELEPLDELAGTRWHNLKIAPLSFKDKSNQEQYAAVAYSRGPLLSLSDESQHKIIARFNTVAGRPPAIIGSEFGAGKIALASTPIELRGASLKKQFENGPFKNIDQDDFEKGKIFSNALAAQEGKRDELWGQIWDYLLER